jgi:hypothetical protein
VKAKLPIGRWPAVQPVAGIVVARPGGDLWRMVPWNRPRLRQEAGGGDDAGLMKREQSILTSASRPG